MRLLIPPNKSRLLLVEGKEDKEFFIQLGKHLQFPEATPLYIAEYEGKDKLAGYISLLLQEARFKTIEHIGIVRDADFGTSAFRSVISAIENANRNSRRTLPVPQEHLQPSKGAPTVSVLILPSVEREGMLEDLILDVLEEDPVTACVDGYFACLGDNQVEIAQERLPKARARVFITGKNVGAEATGADSEKLYLSDIYKMSWWRDNGLWDNCAFDTAKNFLKQVLAS